MRLETYASPRLGKTPQTRLTPFRTLLGVRTFLYAIQSIEAKHLYISIVTMKIRKKS